MRLNKKITAFACGLIALTGFAINNHHQVYADSTDNLQNIGVIAQDLSQNAFRIKKGTTQIQGSRNNKNISVEKLSASRINDLNHDKIPVGWPYHELNDGRGLWSDTFKDAQYWHDDNIAGHLHAGDDGYDLYQATFPKDANGKTAKSYVLTINYDNAVEYNGKTYDAQLTIHSIKYYDQDYWADNTDIKPDVWFNNKLSDGVWFDGITSAKATLSVPGLHWVQGRPAFVSFNGLDSVNTTTQNIKDIQSKVDKKTGETLDAINSFWNNEYFFQRRAQDYKTFTFTSDPLKNKQDNAGQKWLDANWDQTGKWVNWEDGNTGYKYEKGKKTSDVGTYKSKVEGMRVTGGLPGKPFRNAKDSGSYFSHSILYYLNNPKDGSAQKTDTPNGVGTTFTFGSGEGYGNFTITTKTLSFANHESKEVEYSKGSLKKTVNNDTDKSNRLHKQGQTFTYHIKGKLPYRKEGWTYESTTEKNKQVNVGSDADQFTYPLDKITWNKVPTNPTDDITITDDVPQQLTVTSAYSNILKLDINGNHISTHLNYQQLLDATKNKQRDYDITINVKADNLPQPNDTGFHDEGPSKNGLYHIKNTAKMTGKVNEQPVDNESSTDTTIQRRMGVIHHYDFDHANKGDFNGFGINWGSDNFQNKTNYDGSKIRDDTYVYGYENDTKTIHADDNIYDNDGAHYNPYVESGSVTLGSNNSSDANDMVDNFYMPYYQTKFQTIVNLMKIDTNKWKDGLPFHISQRNQSFLYKDLSQYNDGSETISIYQVLNNGGKVKVYDTTKNFTDMLGQGPHSDYWWNIYGTLRDMVDPATGQKPSNPDNGYLAGKKLNFVVEATFNNPHKISIPKSGTNFSTYGFISSESTLNNDSFNNNNYAVLNPVERTIAYNGAKQIRELREAIRLDQDRTANAKTGYGMKNDLKLTYAGWNNVNGFNSDENLNNINFMNDSAQLNYVFPRAFASNGLDHDTDSINKDRASGFKNSDSAINYNAYNGINALNDDLDGSSKGHFLQDHLEQLTNYQNNDSLTPAIDNNGTKATLDTFNNASSDNVDRMNDAKNLSWDNPVNEFTETPSSFVNEYRFYDRIVNFGVNLPNGVVGLGSSADPEASNKVSFDAQNTDGGYRFYTPYWLSLKTDSVDGNWPTYWERANNHRFGANWFNINDRRPVTFYGHMYLANGSKSDQGDELSIQPIMTAKQIPNGFSQQQIDWLKHYATFK